MGNRAAQFFAAKKGTVALAIGLYLVWFAAFGLLFSVLLRAWTPALLQFFDPDILNSGRLLQWLSASGFWSVPLFFGGLSLFAFCYYALCGFCALPALLALLISRALREKLDNPVGGLRNGQ